MKQLFKEEQKKEERRAPRQRLRDKRRNRRIVVACLCAFTAIALIGSLGGVSHLDQLAINDVAVSGAVRIEPQALSAAVAAGLDNDGFRLFSKSNMFLYPRRSIEEALVAEFPRIKDVSLSRPSPLSQSVLVAVEERAGYAKWCLPKEVDDDTCYLLDSEGFIFAQSAGEETVIPYVLYGGLAKTNPVGQWFLRGRLAGVVALLDQLGNKGFPVREFTVDSEKDFSIRLQSGMTLYMSFDVDSQKNIANLETVLEDVSVRSQLDSLEYIDLRFGNRVYFK